MKAFLAIFCVLVCLTKSYAADPPAPAAAKQASDLMQAHDDAVKAADQKTIAGLKKLMTKYKKDAPTLTMLAVKLHKLDPNDADAIAALKDVPADQQDLLGGAAEPGKYITDVQAKIIADALAKGKFTGKDWDALSGTAQEILGTKGWTDMRSGIPCAKGTRLLVVPNPDDKWKERKGDAATDYKGIGGNLMALRIKFAPANDKEDGRDFPTGGVVLIPSDGAFTLNPKSSTNGDAVGSMHVKVYEVVQAGE